MSTSATATTAAVRRGRAFGARPPGGSRWTGVAGLAALLGVSLYLRTRVLGGGFWIDEGLSVGIASHPLGDIPGLLRQDGSPPLYYVLLHGWMELFGRGEAATQALSLAFALLTVPAAYWAGRSLAGPRAAWICAALAAVNPFLTAHAQDARMYSLVVLLSLLATATFVHAFAHRRRRCVAPFAVALVALLYTHNWSLFFTAGALAAMIVCVRRAPADERRPLLRDAALAFGAAFAAYAPWLPSLAFQAQHTGAPWATSPAVGELLRGVSAALGGNGPAIAVLLAAGAGLAAVLARARHRTAVLAALTLVVTLLGSAWLSSQVEPAWAFRYLAVALGPLLLLAGIGLAHAARLGLVALAIVVAFWAQPHTFDDSPTSERAVGEGLGELLRPGDLVLVAHPERVPVLDYYLPAGLGYATPLGPVADPGVMDWRDALDRLTATDAGGLLTEAIEALPPGRRLALVTPITSDGPAWRSPWTSLVAERSREWSRAVAGDPRLRWVDGIPEAGEPRRAGIQAVVYERRAGGTPGR